MGENVQVPEQVVVDDADVCWTCEGQGWEQCDEPESPRGCSARDCNGVEHECPNCGGSGLAKDVWYW